MIERIRTWLDRSGPVPADPVGAALRLELADARAEIQRLEQLAADRGFIGDHAAADLKKINAELGTTRQQLDHATEQVLILERQLTQARADLTLQPCECGGDTELYWRREASLWQSRALQDRANAVVMADRLAAAEGRPAKAGSVV